MGEGIFWRAKRAENFTYFKQNIDQILAVFENTKKRVCIDFLVYCTNHEEKTAREARRKILVFLVNF